METMPGIPPREGASQTAKPLGPRRDFVGYGRHLPKVEWPGGHKIAINLVINYEEGAEYSLLDGDPINDSFGEYSYQVGPTVRDIGTESHMEFGSRVGIWRLVRMIDDLGIPITVDACAMALERNPELCEWIRESTHDVMGHGYRWTEDSRMTRDEERTYMKLAIASIRKATGHRVRGWIVRSFPSVNTRELLIEEGEFLYDSDGVNDELPYWTLTGDDHFLVVPYSKIYNDVKYLIPPHPSAPDDFFLTLKDGLDYLVAEADAGHGNRMMTVGLHPRWSGQAARAKPVRNFIEYALEKEGAGFMRRLDIAQHWIDHHAPDPLD